MHLPCNPCAVSGHHGSVISCASLPDDSSLPQPDFSNTAPPLSRQVSEAASSCFDRPESLSNAAASAEIQASAGSRSSLRHNRAVSWSPERTARLNAVRPTYQIMRAFIQTSSSFFCMFACFALVRVMFSHRAIRYLLVNQSSVVLVHCCLPCVSAASFQGMLMLTVSTCQCQSASIVAIPTTVKRCDTTSTSVLKCTPKCAFI